MKKKRNWKLLLPMAIIISALFAIAGCQKPNSPPTPTPEAPVITVKIVPSGTLAYGDSASISWSVLGQTDYILLDNNPVKKDGSVNTGRIFATENHKIVATGPGGSASKTFAIKVGDWTTSVYGMISHGHWVFGSLSEKSDLTHNLWVVFTKEQTGPLFYTFAYYFHPNGIWQIKNRITSKLITSGDWDIKEDSLIYKEGSRSLILQATNDTLSTGTSSYVTEYNGKINLVYSRLIYIRDTTK